MSVTIEGKLDSTFPDLRICSFLNIFGRLMLIDNSLVFIRLYPALQQFSLEYVGLQFHTTRQKQSPHAVKDCLFFSTRVGKMTRVIIKEILL